MTSNISKLNFASKRELKYMYGTETGARWAGNYICRLHNRAKSGLQTSKLKEFLDIASVDTNWYERPYSTLLQAAKLTASKEYKPYTPAGYFDRTDVVWLLSQRRRMHALKDNSFTRICKRYYPASAIDKIIEQCDWSAGPNWYRSPEYVLHNAARVVSYLKKYDKQDLKHLKKVTDPNGIRVISECAEDMRRLECGCYRNDIAQTMSESQIDALKKKLCKALMAKAIPGNAEEQYWGNKENIIINQVMWASGRVSCANITNTAAFEKAAKATLELNKVCEMHDIAKQLGLHAEERYCSPWRASRVNNKTYRLMKQCKQAFDKGTPLEAVHQVISKRSKQISMETYNRCIITPILTPIENK